MTTPRCPKHGLAYQYRKKKNGGQQRRCPRCNAESVMRYRAKVRDAVFKMLGGRCSRCGIDDYRVLHLHHKDPSTKIQSKVQWKMNMKKALEEAKGCELLCANCHLIFHEEQYGSSINRPDELDAPGILAT